MRRLLTLALAMALFTALAAPAMAARPDFSKKSDLTIVETAVADGRFDVLVAAVVSSGAIDLFDGQDWTVFAPTDAAFVEFLNVATEQEAIDAVTAAGPALLPILAYHLTEGVRVSPSVVNPPFVTMLMGATISVDSDLAITANNSTANIVIPNLRVADGVIHAIDYVLVP